MLKKSPKPQYIRYIKGSAKVLFAVEAVLFAASYGIWYRMNTSRDFRLYMHNNYSWILEGYYKIGETLSSDSRPVRARELDFQIPTDYSSRNESLKKRQAVVDVLRRAAENKDPMYRQTKEEIDSLRTDDATKKRS
ncbi:hypothetical protein C0J52_06658 [Blattella germanica]|nr:hypothetical protein C0J52_06658 [Blattella germanica]